MEIHGNLSCEFPETSSAVVPTLLDVNVFGILPIYLFMHSVTTVLILIVYCKRSKTDNSYVYQMSLVMNEMLEALSLAYLTVSFYLTCRDNTKHLLYKQSSLPLTFATYVILPLNESLTTNSLLIAVAMTAERLFALCKPMAFKAANHKCHQAVAISLCALISLGTSIYSISVFEIRLTQDGYLLTGSASDIGQALMYICSAVRLIGLCLLITLNALVVRNYRLRNQKVVEITNDSAEKNQLRKTRERSLIVLSFSMSTFRAVVILTEILFFSAVFYMPNFHRYENLLILLQHMIVQCIGIGNTASLFFVCENFRNMLRGVFRTAFSSNYAS